ncbi:hypothetical protein TNCV_939591 [Trichonephila clavipes]|nr:hypothetical protein TNCV_939591 [Trichonephila clavipes]
MVGCVCGLATVDIDIEYSGRGHEDKNPCSKLLHQISMKTLNLYTFGVGQTLYAWLATLTSVSYGLGSNRGEDMDVCKCIVPSRHGGALNSRRAASPLVWLGGGSPNRRCLCVRRVFPRRSLVHITCSRRLLDDGTVGVRMGMMLCNLFSVCSSQFDCHTLCSFCLKQAFRSECGIGNLSEEPVTDRAAVEVSNRKSQIIPLILRYETRAVQKH